MRAIMLFGISLFTALFWGVFTAVIREPLWVIATSTAIGFLGGWFAYGLCAGGAIKEEPKL